MWRKRYFASVGHTSSPGCRSAIDSAVFRPDTALRSDFRCELLFCVARRVRCRTVGARCGKIVARCCEGLQGWLRLLGFLSRRSQIRFVCPGGCEEDSEADALARDMPLLGNSVFPEFQNAQCRVNVGFFATGTLPRGLTCFAACQTCRVFANSRHVSLHSATGILRCHVILSVSRGSVPCRAPAIPEVCCFPRAWPLMLSAAFGPHRRPHGCLAWRLSRRGTSGCVRCC